MGLIKTLTDFVMRSTRVQLPPDANDRLKRIIQAKLIDEESLRDIALKYSLLSFEREPKLGQREEHVRIFDYERDMRIFLIRKVISELNIKYPSNLIECGSAGDLSAALALPDTKITALDDDPDVFINEITCLPKEWFDSVGLKRVVAYYGDAWRKRFFKRNMNIVDGCLPNYERVIGDGKQLEDGDGTYDFALVQGTPDMLYYFKRELSRVIKPRGYLASIVIDRIHPHDSPSFYDTGEYAGWVGCEWLEELGRKDSEQEGLPLETVEISSNLKALERLCTWDSSGWENSAGAVFEIFRKK